MKDNKRRIVVITIIAVVTLLVTMVGATYAFFNATVHDENSNITNTTITAATLGTITFSHGNVIDVTDIYPGWEQTIDFTVTADPNSTEPVDYDVYLKTSKNILGPNYTNPAGVETAREETENFVAFLQGPTGSIVNLERVDTNNPLPVYGDANYKTAGTPIALATFNNTAGEDEVLIGRASLPAQGSHTWTLTVRLREMDADQINDQGREYTGTLVVKAASEYTASGESRRLLRDPNSLAYNIVNNAKEVVNGTEYKETPVTNPAQQVSTAAEKELIPTRDDYGTTYYYRGAVEDNYITFANMCWRIVRIEGDGSIKLVLEDQDQVCSDSMNGNWNIPLIPNTSSRSANFGYKLHNDAQNVADILNEAGTDSTAQIEAYKSFQANTLLAKIRTAYNDQTLELNSYLKSGNWCYNDAANSKLNGTGDVITNKADYYGTASFYYDTRVRIEGKNPKQATLLCNGTVLTNYDQNTLMYVGALTADEIAFAGGTYGGANSTYYLNNGYAAHYWTMTPYFYNNNGGYDSAYYVHNNGGMFDSSVTGSYNIRPAVTLKADLQISGGRGTKGSPYTLSQVS